MGQRTVLQRGQRRDGRRVSGRRVAQEAAGEAEELLGIRLRSVARVRPRVRQAVAHRMQAR